MRKWALLVVAALMATVLLAACGGGEGEEEEQGPAAPAAATATSTAQPEGQAMATATPATTEAAAAAQLRCEAPSDVKSFRYVVAMKLDIPELREAQGAGDTGQGFLGAFPGAFTDMEMHGAFVAPDRSEIRMRMGQDELVVITIGDRQWTKLPGGNWIESPASGEAEPFSPATLCEESFSDLELSGLKGKEETINGIKTRRYHLERTDLEALARLFGGLEEEVQDLPEQFVTDLWLAKDGNWPVRIEVKASGKDQQGRDFSIEVRMEIKDLNDSGIKIEPPM